MNILMELLILEVKGELLCILQITNVYALNKERNSISVWSQRKNRAGIFGQVLEADNY